jgi:molybdate transport system substrate-binding protein
MRRIITLFLALMTAVPAFAAGPLVLAAASLQESLNAAADAWAAKHHARPTLSCASSSALARQIEAGAPADLFISADETWMDEVAKHGLIRPGSRVSFLANSLVLIAPAGSAMKPVAIKRGFPLAALLGRDKLAMGEPNSVPAGIYGKEALTSLGVWNAVAPKVASGDNVRAALALVERGEAPYGIVYATDAIASKKVRVVGTFPASSHAPIIYPLALLTSSTSPDAEGFRRFLLSPAAKAIFQRNGFRTK